jgi:hypothetical protein
MRGLLLVTALFCQAAIGQSNDLAAVTARLASAQAAMPEYFSIKTNTDDSTISIHTIRLYELTYDISLWPVGITGLDEPAPGEISLMLIGPAGMLDGAMQLHYHGADKTFDKPEQHPRPNHDSVWLMVTLDEFRAIAWSEVAWLKIGGRTHIIARTERIKWRLLWNYYDLQRQKQRLEQGTLKK